METFDLFEIRDANNEMIDEYETISAARRAIEFMPDDQPYVIVRVTVKQ